MGTPMFAVPILKSLYQNGYPISDIYTQPPQKSQRGQKINKSPIQGIAETLNLDFRSPKYLKDNKEEYEYFQSIDADLAIVVAYGQIIPKEFLTLTKKGFINIHASLLPKWRGAAPIQRSIMNLDTETGVSIMKIAEELDTGPVCNTYKINLENNLNASDVADKLSLIAAEKILDNIEEYEYLKKINADLAIVVAYGQIIPKKFLSLTKKGFINIHASLLPKWRGAAPIQRSIMNLDTETGISIMKIAEELDTGPVCSTYKINLENYLNASDVADKLSLIAAEKILENIDNILEDRVKFIDQDHSKATYASKIQKAEGEINWNDEAKVIIGKINGLHPVPGAFFIYKGERYKILKAEIGNGVGKPGEVVSNYLEVVCGDKQTIKIKEIQRQGKKPQNIGEFMLGSQIKQGTVI